MLKLDVKNVVKISKDIKKTNLLNKTNIQDTIKSTDEGIFKALKKDKFEFNLNQTKFDESSVQPIKTQFDSYISAQNYAKHRAVAPLNSSEPYEHLILVDKKTNTILGEYKGNGETVKEGVLGFLKSPKDVSQVHGHPTMFVKDGKPYTSPVSWHDFAAINNKGSEIFAYNASGEFSVIRKTPQFQKLSESEIQHYEALYDDFINNLFICSKGKDFPDELKGVKNLEELINRCNSLKSSGKSREYLKDLQNKINALLQEFNSSYDVIKGVDSFWKKYADELGIMYRTNYSYLK